MNIPLSKGKEAVIDDDMGHLSRWRWFFNEYPIRSYKNHKKVRQTYLHHAIIGYPLHGFVVDHINGNVLDNRRCNLRIVSQRENSWNRKEHRDGKLHGAYQRGEKWISQIKINKKLIYLGTFKTKEEAAQAYQDKCREVL